MPINTEHQLTPSPKKELPYADYAKQLMERQKPPDPTLTPTLAEPTPVEPSALPTSSEPTATNVPFELWEALAYDLALSDLDPQHIAQAYELTLEQLQAIQTNPYFKKIQQAKQDEVKQLGTDATFAVKMRMVANKSVPHLFQRLTALDTSNRDFLAMFKIVTELAQLTPQPNLTDNNTAVVGTNITLNISGVPGLEHLTTTTQAFDTQATEIECAEVIEPYPTPTSTPTVHHDELQEL